MSHVPFLVINHAEVMMKHDSIYQYWFFDKAY